MSGHNDTDPILEDETLPHRGVGNLEDNELDPELTGCGATPCCNPSSPVHRFIALIFMCLLGFGSYFCYDNPAALQDHFIQDLNITVTQFTVLYSIYSWPNVILCFIGGFLIDRVFGIRMGTIIYLFILLVGQILFASGTILDEFWLAIVGRFVFGIGAESLAVAQNNYAVVWFKGKELNMVFGLQLSFARVGSTVNFVVMEPIYKYVASIYKGHTALGVVLMLSGLTCIMSFICALILGLMDKRAQRVLRRNDNPHGETVKLTDIATFKITFWMVSVICVAYYVAIFPFIALAKVFFMDKFHFTADQANGVTSIVYIIAAVASPLFGFTIDRLGRNVTWMILSIGITIGAHLLMAFTYVNPYVGMSFLGLAYSMLASSLWPLVALIVPEYQLGTAYGICQSVQNLGLAVVIIAAGAIKDHSGYTWVEIFFLAWLTLSLIATIVIWIHDKRTHGNLNMTPAQRQAYSSAITSRATDRFIGSASVEDVGPDDIGSSNDSPVARHRHRGGGGRAQNGGSDQEPLLN